MSWNFNDNLPIYLQIMQIIKMNIASGKYSPGDKLPSVRELAVDAGVNPNTMQRALAELEREGFLFSQRTTGRFVSDNPKLMQTASKEIAYEYINRMIEQLTVLGFSKEKIIPLVEYCITEKGNDAKH